MQPNGEYRTQFPHRFEWMYVVMLCYVGTGYTTYNTFDARGRTKQIPIDKITSTNINIGFEHKTTNGKEQEMFGEWPRSCFMLTYW